MTIKSKKLNDLLQYFSEQNSSNHIVSLALTANDTGILGLKQQTITLDYQPWNLFDIENSSVATLLHQYTENSSATLSSTSSSLQYASFNDTFANYTQNTVKPRISTEIPIWLIPCYSIILIFAIVGNLLVASTLFQNRRMRTITNVFLANLAISDMLLGVLCMPITLVGTYLRHFIFGELVCKFIQFAQAASVAVSSWTLVAISCERYYAICHPLRSRTWQTINHAYKIIGCIWFGSIICMAPIAIFSHLIPTSRQGLRKCREQWPEEAVGYERFYNIFLDLVLLVLPLVILCVAYFLITRTLYMGIRDEKALIFGNKNNNMTLSGTDTGAGGTGTSNGTTSETKIYTQVEAPTVFNLNMSFRYQTRKTNCNSLVAGSGESLHIPRTPIAANNNGRDNFKYYAGSSTENNKYSAMGQVTVPLSGSKRILYLNTTQNSEAETEISFKDSKEQNHKLQSVQQPQNELQQLQQQQQEQNCPVTDDQIQKSGCTASTAVVMTTSTNNRRNLISKSMGDGRRSQLYCMRSASVKSLNRSNGSKIVGSESDETTASSSCYSLNTMPRFQHRHSLNQKYYQRQQQQLEQQQYAYQHQMQTTDVLEQKRKLNSTPSLRITESTLRRSNLEKNLESKKRVVKMLFVLVLEFFICWTPLYVINTVAMFIGPAIYEYVDYTTISFFQLLAYSSSCCNPITYCFMNASFRRAFVDTFKGMHLNGGSFWHKSSKTATNLSMAGNSIALANSCTMMTANTVLDSPRL